MSGLTFRSRRKPDAGSSEELITPFGTWDLSLLPHPEPLADLFHETCHRASLRRFAEMFVPRACPVGQSLLELEFNLRIA
jgi:hypothetical protein